MKLVPLSTVLLFDRKVISRISPNDKIASTNPYAGLGFSEMIVSHKTRWELSLCAFLSLIPVRNFLD